MDTKGQQLLLDAWLEEDLSEEIVARICEIVRRRFTVVAETRHDFVPQGTTLAFVLSESHFALHTYPEHRYFSLDLYICNLGADLDAFQAEVLAGLKVLHKEVAVRRRGYGPRKLVSDLPLAASQRP